MLSNRGSTLTIVTDFNIFQKNAKWSLWLYVLTEGRINNQVSIEI